MLPPFSRSKKSEFGGIISDSKFRTQYKFNICCTEIRKSNNPFLLRKLHSNLFTSQHCIYGVQFGHYGR